MVSPIDYTLKIADPFQSALQGYQAGAAIRDDRAQQAAVIAEAQKKAEQDARRQAALQRARESRDPQALVDISIEFPELSEQMKRSYDMQSDSEKKESLSLGWQVLSAIDAGNIPAAKAKLEGLAIAFRNSGNKQMAKAYEDAAQAVELDPEGARTIIGGSLAAIDKDFVKTYTDFRTSGSTIGKAEAEAEKAGVEAKFAEPKAFLDLEQSGWNIKKIKSEIQTSQSNAKIYALNARIAAEKNAIEQQRLRIQRDNLLREQENDINDRVALATGAQSAIADIGTTVNDLRKHPGFKSLFGAGVPFERMVPGTDAAGAAVTLDKLKALAFSVGVEKMRGLGALGVLEGKRVEAALASLEVGMPEKDALKALSDIEMAMARMDKANQERYGAPPASSFARQEVTRINSQDEYDSLPSGAVYIDLSDGKKYRKP